MYYSIESESAIEVFNILPVFIFTYYYVTLYEAAKMTPIKVA